MMMKNITASVLLVFLFIFSISNKAKSAAAAELQPVVVDSDGDELRPGVEYYIRGGLLAPTNGLLDLGSSPNRLCPKDVIQTQSTNIGRPVVFYPINTTESVVREATDLNIMFLPSIDPYCRTSNVWKVDDYDPSSGKWWVTNGGAIGNPGPQTLKSWFKLHRVRDSRFYHIHFCPSVCESCATLCNSLTLRYLGEDQQNRRLCLATKGLNGWYFWFFKASSSAIKQVVGN